MARRDRYRRRAVLLLALQAAAARDQQAAGTTLLQDEPPLLPVEFSIAGLIGCRPAGLWAHAAAAATVGRPVAGSGSAEAVPNVLALGRLEAGTLVWVRLGGEARGGPAPGGLAQQQQEEEEEEEEEWHPGRVAAAVFHPHAPVPVKLLYSAAEAGAGPDGRPIDQLVRPTSPTFPLPVNMQPLPH